MRKKFNYTKLSDVVHKQKDNSIKKSTNKIEQKKIYDKFYLNIQALIGIEKLVFWAESRSRKVNIFFSKDEECFAQGNTVVINTKSNYIGQLCYLIHEIGHVLMHTNASSCKEKFPKGYFVIEGNSKHKNVIKTDAHRIDVVAEEIEAWTKGKSLAKKLGVSFPENIYERRRMIALKTYFKWALRVKGYDADIIVNWNEEDDGDD